MTTIVWNRLEQTVCLKCGKQLTRVTTPITTDWTHRDGEGTPRVGCRAATYSNKNGWDDSVPKGWSAEPDPARIKPYYPEADPAAHVALPAPGSPMGAIFMQRQAAMAELDEARKENTRLRGLLADANIPCIYCKLPKDNIKLCPRGFPGCGRMDDLLAGGHV